MEIDAIRELFSQRNAFARETGVVIEDLSPGWAVATLAIEPRHLNLFGTANAGAIFTLAETAFGAAANSHGNQAVAASFTITYLKAAAGTLTAQAKEAGAGGPLASYAVTVLDAAGAVVAQAQGLAYRRKQSLEELL